MTRKRFVKLLMADGYSRNQANSIARETSTEGLSYSLKFVFLRVANESYDIFEPMKITMEKMVDVLVDVIPSVVQAIMNLIPVAEDAAKAITTLQKELEAQSYE